MSEDYLVIQQRDFGDDDLDAQELDDYRQWAQGFDDERGNDDDDDDDYYEDEFRMPIAKPFQHFDREVYDTYVPELPKKSHPAKDAQPVNISEKVESDMSRKFGESRFEYGASILPYCSNAIDGAGIMDDIGGVMDWGERMISNPKSLQCPDTDVIKMVIEMLLGTQNDIFSIRKSAGSIGLRIPNDFRAEIIVPLTFPSTEICLTDLGSQICTQSLSNGTLISMLRLFAKIGADLSVCRDFGRQTEIQTNDPLIRSVFASQCDNIHHLVNTFDAELTKLEAQSLRQKDSEIRTTRLKADAVHNFSAALLSESCLFPLNQSLSSDHDQNEYSGDQNVGKEGLLTLIKIYCVVSGWRSTLQSTVAFVRSLSVLPRLESIVSEINNEYSKALRKYRRTPNPSAPSEEQQSLAMEGDIDDLTIRCYPEMYLQLLLRQMHNFSTFSLLQFVEIPTNSKCCSANENCGELGSGLAKNLTISFSEQPSRNIFEAFILSTTKDIVSSFLTASLNLRQTMSTSSLRDKGPMEIDRPAKSNDFFLLPEYLKLIMEKFVIAETDIAILNQENMRSGSRLALGRHHELDLQQTLQSSMVKFEECLRPESCPRPTNSLVAFGNRKELTRVLKRLKSHEFLKDSPYTEPSWRYHCILQSDPNFLALDRSSRGIYRKLIRSSTDNILSRHNSHVVNWSVGNAAIAEIHCKPLSELLLLADGLDSSCLSLTTGPIGELAPSFDPFGAVDTSRALNSLAASRSLSSLVGTPEAPFRSTTNCHSEPHILNCVRTVTIPVLETLSNMQRTAVTRLVVGEQLTVFLSFLQCIYCLGDQHAFQPIRDLFYDDLASTIIWENGDEKLRSKQAVNNGLQSPLSKSRIEKSNDVDSSYDDAPEDAMSEYSSDGDTYSSVSIRTKGKVGSESYWLWTLCQTIKNKIDTLAPVRSKLGHLDVQLTSTGSSAQALFSPSIARIAESIVVDMALTWPLRAIITIKHINSYNKILQFLMPILVLKWACDSIWKESMAAVSLKQMTASVKLPESLRLRRTGAKSVGPISKQAKFKSSKTSENVSTETIGEAEALEKSLKGSRRNASAGLQMIMHSVNMILSLYMTNIHEGVFNKFKVTVKSALDNECCQSLCENHEKILRRMLSLVDILRVPVLAVIERGFCAVAVLKGATKLLPKSRKESSGLVFGSSLHVARLKNEAAHLRRAESAIMSFRTSLQLLTRTATELLAHSNQTRYERNPSSRTDIVAQIDGALEFVSSLVEQLRGIFHL